jgi:hypothetical protein
MEMPDTKGKNAQNGANEGNGKGSNAHKRTEVLVIDHFKNAPRVRLQKHSWHCVFA